MGSNFGPQKPTNNWSWAAAVTRTLTLTPTLTPWKSDFFEIFWKILNFFEISGKTFCFVLAQNIFQTEFFLAASGRARSGRSKNMLISGFWDIWLSARRVFGRIWILQILPTNGHTRSQPLTTPCHFEIRGSIFLYYNTCARARRRKQPRVNSFGKTNLVDASLHCDRSLMVK